ncbi:MAG TPA: hypothetical protein VIM69_01715 [Opitutaceae bacterium]
MQESHQKSGHQHDLSRDRRLVSEEPHEIAYVVDRLAEQFPKQDRADLRRIVSEAKRNIQPSESRELLMEEARRLIRER